MAPNLIERDGFEFWTHRCAKRYSEKAVDEGPRKRHGRIAILNNCHRIAVGVDLSHDE
jgi:hypothetical protein